MAAFCILRNNQSWKSVLFIFPFFQKKKQKTNPAALLTVLMMISIPFIEWTQKSYLDKDCLSGGLPINPFLSDELCDCVREHIFSLIPFFAHKHIITFSAAL